MANRFLVAALDEGGEYCAAGRVSEYEQVLRALTGILTTERPSRGSGYLFLPPFIVGSSAVDAELRALAAFIQATLRNELNYDSRGELLNERWTEVQTIAGRLIKRLLVR